MAKFVPSQHVDRLEYDFTDYGGTEGVIPEPSTGKVNTFFTSMKAMMKEVGELQKLAQGLDIEEEMDLTDEETIAKMTQVEEATEGASKFQLLTIENLAILCGAERDEETGVVTGGSPSVEEFQKLPYRVLQAFSQWLMGEIRPKATTRDSRPSPQDRQRRTS